MVAHMLNQRVSIVLRKNKVPETTTRTDSSAVTVWWTRNIQPSLWIQLSMKFLIWYLADQGVNSKVLVSTYMQNNVVCRHKRYVQD